MTTDAKSKQHQLNYHGQALPFIAGCFSEKNSLVTHPHTRTARYMLLSLSKINVDGSSGSLSSFDRLTAGSILSEFDGFVKGRGRDLKCAFRSEMGSKAVVPCGAYDVACTPKNPIHVEKNIRMDRQNSQELTSCSL